MPVPKLTPYFKNAANNVLDILSGKKEPKKQPWTDPILAAAVGVSSSLIQRILAYLLGKGLVQRSTEGWTLERALRKEDYFMLDGVELSQGDSVDNFIVKQLSSGRFRPGEKISELKLAREANVSTGSIRESLLRLSRFGVIEKNARRQWRVIDWSAPKIDHLIEWRLLVETHCLEKLLTARPTKLMEKLTALLEEHKSFLKSKNLSREKFSGMDEQLHDTILAASENPFLEDAFRTIWFIIQFQFQHHALDASAVAVGCEQHIDLLEAILGNQKTEAKKSLTSHMQTAGKTLKRLSRAL